MVANFSFEFIQGGMMETQETRIYPKYVYIYYTRDGKSCKTRRIDANTPIVKGTIKYKDALLFSYKFSVKKMDLSVYPFVNGVQAKSPIKVTGNKICCD